MSQQQSNNTTTNNNQYLTTPTTNDKQQHSRFTSSPIQFNLNPLRDSISNVEYDSNDNDNDNNNNNNNQQQRHNINNNNTDNNISNDNSNSNTLTTPDRFRSPVSSGKHYKYIQSSQQSTPASNELIERRSSVLSDYHKKQGRLWDISRQQHDKQKDNKYNDEQKHNTNVTNNNSYNDNNDSIINIPTNQFIRKQKRENKQSFITPLPLTPQTLQSFNDFYSNDDSDTESCCSECCSCTSQCSGDYDNNNDSDSDNLVDCDCNDCKDNHDINNDNIQQSSTHHNLLPQFNNQAEAAKYIQQQLFAHNKFKQQHSRNNDNNLYSESLLDYGQYDDDDIDQTAEDTEAELQEILNDLKLQLSNLSWTLGNFFAPQVITWTTFAARLLYNAARK